VITDRIIRRIFFEDTIHFERYMEQLLCPVFEWLTDEECRHTFFHQDSVYWSYRKDIHRCFEGNVYGQNYL
jgi:hypothetical protein